MRAGKKVVEDEAWQVWMGQIKNSFVSLLGLFYLYLDFIPASANLFSPL